MERQLQKLSWLKIKEMVPEKIDTIVLPVGTIEAHGATCLGTDNYIPQTIALGIAERINALVAPILNYGITRSLYRYNGGITVQKDTYGSLITEILDGLVDSGFKNIIIMNGHGGNNGVLKDVACEFHQQAQVNVAVIHWWELCAQMTEQFFGHAGGHAGTDETAMILALDPAMADKTDYDPDLAYLFTGGADIYPVPGTILLYKEGEGYPEYDVEKSKQYHDKVIEKVGEFVEMVLGRWRKFGL